MRFDAIVANMAYKLQRSVVIAVAGSLCLSAISVFADSYRWKDKDGEVHYGAAVPPEYADQPYDVLNDAGMVIRHVKVTREPEQVSVEPEAEEDTAAVAAAAEEERQRKSDRLLMIQYQSEQDIRDALELKITQLGYESKIVKQSFDSTTNAIRDQVRLAADQQRAGVPVSNEQQKQMNKLYRRLARDQKRLSALDERESKIHTHFKSDLDRYRLLQTPDPG